MEIDEPVLTEESYQFNYTNEGGVEGKIRLLKNINGLWIMQNLRKNWCEFEAEVSFPDIIKASREAKRQDFIIDPNDHRFTAPYNMMNEVIAYCEEHGQGTPDGLGEIAMAIYNGLTYEYKTTVANLEVITGKTIPCINMVGGGIQDQLLCELTANATGKKVVAGPIEGSVLGNIVMQLKAINAIESLEEGRKIIKASFAQKIHMPK
jgi:rhamnulokinase